jgi:hypothetical protein
MITLNRIAKTLSDMTVGTVIVLVHVALADKQKNRERTKPKELN